MSHTVKFKLDISQLGFWLNLPQISKNAKQCEMRGIGRSNLTTFSSYEMHKTYFRQKWNPFMLAEMATKKANELDRIMYCAT